jgi:hypothetical protein
MKKFFVEIKIRRQILIAGALAATVISGPSRAFDASKLDQPAWALAAAHLSLYFRVCKGPLSMNMRMGMQMLVDQMPDGLPDRVMKLTQKELAEHGKKVFCKEQAAMMKEIGPTLENIMRAVQEDEQARMELFKSATKPFVEPVAKPGIKPATRCVYEKNGRCQQYEILNDCSRVPSGHSASTSH